MRKIRQALQTRSFSSDTLVFQVQRACERLAEHGWQTLLQKHGLDICATDLRSELLGPLGSIDRTFAGFEDLSKECVRGIEPGRPAHSLLYHAFASPQVVSTSQVKLTDYPTPAEIEAVENLVFGIKPPSIQDLRVRAGDAPLGVVVFAYEYRTAIGTVHQRHADMCFSRVGVARVGTAPAKYIKDLRSFTPIDDDPKRVCVLPCRYAAFIAVRVRGDKSDFGPMRFQKEDADRDFWVPLHKLFSGSECIRNMTLSIKLKSYHLNEKLKRVHQALKKAGYDTGHNNADIGAPPFAFTEDIASFSSDSSQGQGLLIPYNHKRLVEVAMMSGGAPISFKVPPNPALYRSSLNLQAEQNGAREAPEYVHIRRVPGANGSAAQDLNERPDMMKILSNGGYDALHFIDHTGEGIITVECPELAFEVPRRLAAYSIVGAVDYFPFVKQQELMRWWKQSVPEELVSTIWPSNPGPPEALSDTRYAANLDLRLDTLGIANERVPAFDAKDGTMSSIVGLLQSGGGALTRVDELRVERVSTLPDGASGVFAPGWDVSVGRSLETANEDGTFSPGSSFFQNYGLGSPFPEDAMLCAALSSYWPAAAPDVTRAFPPGNYAVTTPLTDDVIGQTGKPAWDGIPGPIIRDASKNEAEFRSLLFGDHVGAALDDRMDYSLVLNTPASEYAARTLVMARVYQALGATTREQKRVWSVFSFMPVLATDYDRQEAEAESGAILNPSFSYRFKMFKPTSIRPNPHDHRSVLVTFDEMLILFADPQCVLKKDDGKWNAYRYGS